MNIFPDPPAPVSPSILSRAQSRLENGKIVAPLNLEMVVTDHCNIACRQCNHASPVMRKWNADVEETARVLNRLAAIYRCDRFRLLGGEPLLHPRFVEIVQATKASGVSRLVQLTTNGMLIDRLSDEGWRALDEIELSVYPVAGLSEARLKELRRKGERFGTVVNVSKYPQFRGTFTTRAAHDPALVDEVWSACKAVNVWSCQTLRGDRLYRCPQSVYVPMLTGGGFTDEGFAVDDGPELQVRLLAFLNAPGPLRSCAHCVGTCGTKFGHEVLSRQGWIEDLDRDYAEMIDYELLERSKVERMPIDDCRKLVRRDTLGRRVMGKLRGLF